MTNKNHKNDSLPKEVEELHKRIGELEADLKCAENYVDDSIKHVFTMLRLEMPFDSFYAVEKSKQYQKHVVGIDVDSAEYAKEKYYKDHPEMKPSEESDFISVVPNENTHLKTFFIGMAVLAINLLTLYVFLK